MALPGTEKFVSAFNRNLEEQAPSGYASTSNLVGIAHILGEFANPSTYQVNFHWGLRCILIEGCSKKGRVMEITSGGTQYLLRPTFLETFYFSRKRDLSFMRLAYKGMKQSGVNSDIPLEELLDLGLEEHARIGKKLYHREIFNQGFLDYDEHGEEIPIPQNAELIVRLLVDGHAIIVSKGSSINQNKAHNIREDLEKNGRRSRYYSEMLGV